MAQNTALLEIAGVLKAIRSHILNGTGISYDAEEVFLGAMQAVIQILCGGVPSDIVLPKVLSPAGLDDAVIARGCAGTIVSTPYDPSGPNLGTQTLVPADGSASQAITFSVPFPNAATQVLYGIRDYSDVDNASVSGYVVKNSLTTTGFSIYVSGGSSGSTCSVDYLPFGN